MSRLPERVDVLIAGSGFAGSLLARGLVEMGLDVLLVDRGRHPRFALGESTTPLGNLALERLALRFGWRDVWELACWGRWKTHHADLRCGLKRGFSFFSTRDESKPPTLVAASPNDDVADTQWLRADVDAELCRRAREAGAQVLEEWEVVELELREPIRAGLRPLGASESPAASTRRSAVHEVRANFLVDGSGAGQLLAGHVGHRLPGPLDTALIYGHVRGLPRIDAPAGAPYPPSWSAVHHLLDVGWMYELRFDDDVASCGIVVDRRRTRERPMAVIDREPTSEVSGFDTYLRGAPRLRERFRATEWAVPVRRLDQIGWRVDPVVGVNWARLPHSVGFIDPMFSTGIAWSLVGVERLLDVLTPGLDVRRRSRRLRAYGDLVDREFDHLAALLEGARATWSDVDALSWYSMVYFAAASFAETQQRLEARLPSALEPRGDLGFAGEVPWAWQGFLGTEDAAVRRALSRARRVALDSEPEACAELLRGHVPEWIESRNVAGLAREDRHPWYAADLDPLMRHAGRLGLRADQVEAGLPRLLGQIGFGELRAARPVPTKSE